MGKEEKCPGGENTKALKLIEVFLKLNVGEEKTITSIVEEEGVILSMNSVVIVE